MQILKKTGLSFILLLFFWVLVFDFQRLLFSIHNWSKIDGFGEWLKVFFYSFRLDIATGSYLSFIPILFISAYITFQKHFLFVVFKIVLLFELILVVMIHAGEINAYGEWNHKLTSRVFVHLSNPDEVFRTADYSMTFWFLFYFIIEFIFGYKIAKWIFKKSRWIIKPFLYQLRLIVLLPCLPVLLGLYFLFARGGWQQIPINIDAAYFSKNYTINDVSVNSTYFFGKSYLLYNRSNIGDFLTHYSNEEIENTLHDFLHYKKKHDNFILNDTSPNLVFIVLEGWSAKVSNLLTGESGFTPEFDSLSKEGVLFTNFYSTGSTSEIGNASIFSGFPALPEISISMQPSKHRQLKTINQSLFNKKYSSGYLFSGDLNYGNIGSFFIDHNFDWVEDERDFPSGLKRGKLNYFDEDLYTIFLGKINQQKTPFLIVAFTGSTHSPYDFPANDNPIWKGLEEKYINSIIYADQCLGDFMKQAKKQSWYDNTLFVIVADHGHASPYCTNPNDSDFYHIPLLLYGDALKNEFKGQIIDKYGSQADIPQTLLYQLGIDTKEDYPWSKDLLNPSPPSFALHTTTRGFGWVTPKGKFTFHLDYQKYVVNSFPEEDLLHERKRCDSFMQILYEYYEKL